MTATRRIILASFPVHVGGAKKWSENEELVASFPGHVGGARKWPENEATAMKGWGVLVVHFRKILCTVY